MKTPLYDKIVSLIKETGPLDVATYMQLCLVDPEFGYYTSKAPIGRDGDFITSPEISQLFGELVGVWVIDIWQKMGQPAKFVLAEAGPGRGTLSADVMRTIKRLSPGCHAATALHLIELSNLLKEQQRATLGDIADETVWCSDLSELPANPLLLIGNEFLDALPITQYQRSDGTWAERAIGLDDQGDLIWGLKPAQFSPPADLTPQDGDIFEVCQAAQTFVLNLSQRLKQDGGAALLIDYGHLNRSFGDTLQAVRDHAYCDVLHVPGAADLTAHVDFGALKEIVETMELSCFTATQGGFLLKMGLLERAGALGAGKSLKIQEKIRQDVERLAGADKMGDLFKVMAITSGSFNPHGF